MATVTLTQISNGTTGDATTVDNNFDSLANEMNGNIDQSNLRDASVTTAKLVDGSVTAIKLASSSVTTSKIASEAWTTWTPTFTGFTGTITIEAARNQQLGKFVYCRLFAYGTSNSTSFTATLPVASKSTGRLSVICVDDNGTWSTAGMISLTAGSTTATLYTSGNGAPFTSFGTKGVDGNFFYEAA